MRGDNDSKVGRAVARTLSRYVRAVDSRDWTMLAECFTEDTTVIYLGFNHYEGLDAVVAGCRRSLARFTQTRHLVGDCTIEPSESNKDLVSTCDVIAMHLRTGVDGSAARFTLGGTYTDRLVRRGDNYLIAHRVLEVSWECGDPETMR